MTGYCETLVVNIRNLGIGNGGGYGSAYHEFK